MCIGAFLGIIMGDQVLFLKPVGEAFLKLLMMAAIPLVFFNLLAGLGSIGSVSTFGRVGIKVFVFYLITTMVALTLGLIAVSISKAGVDMPLKGDVPTEIGQLPNIGQLLLDMIPSNIFYSFADGNLIQIVIFAMLLGIVVLQLPDSEKEWFQSGFEKLSKLMRGLVEFILKASPFGLGALMAATFGEYGHNIVGPLVILIVSIYGAHITMVVIYMVLVRFVGQVNPIWFLNQTSSLYATTMATCSSLASLAVSLDIAEGKLKLPKKIFSFSLPLGAQFSKDGTSITLSAILVFTAHAVGLEFSFGEMVQVVLVGLLLSQGSSGIPGGGLVIGMLYAQAFNLPLEVVAIVGGVYRLIDMGNTTINCMGDMVATSIISRVEAGWKPDYKNIKGE